MTRNPIPQGMAGLIISMTSFGLSKSFAGLVVRYPRNPYATKTVTDIPASRCIAGLLNGNMGVGKTMMAELTDSTNRAQASGLIPLVWGVGGTIGCVTLGGQQVQFSLSFDRPLAGGWLSRPHERFPTLFGNWFWEQYPYLLPCLFSAVFCALSFIVTGLLLEEVRELTCDLTAASSDIPLFRP